MRRVIIVMGVSGVGKSTLGRAIAQSLGYTFLEGDDFHPASNIAKMRSSTALTDEDRWPWLSNIVTKVNKSKSVVISCSALRQSYRDFLAKGINAPIHWIHLTLSKEELVRRSEARSNHFMPVNLIDSQLDQLEVPTDSETISIANDSQPSEVLSKVLNALKSDIGVIGMGVMGTSLARNIARNKYLTSIFNFDFPPHEIDVAKKAKEKYAELKTAKPFKELPAFIDSLASPKRILLMITANLAVDEMMAKLKPMLSAGDVVIDGGNSNYKDTERRVLDSNPVGITYLGAGVSGGKKGALEGPAIMCGGSVEGYQSVAAILESIAAKDPAGNSCVNYLGGGGAGHFVKMVHNGIEYAEMQLIAELVDYYSNAVDYKQEEIADVFDQWNSGESKNYLLQITVDILRHKEEGEFLLPKILDVAKSKGTGNWTNLAAGELGVPIPGITAALFARFTSSEKSSRNKLAQNFDRNKKANQNVISNDEIKSAYQLARILNHLQGFKLIQAASKKNNWAIDLSEVARIWSNGCILRSALIWDIAQKETKAIDLLSSDFYQDLFLKNINAYKIFCQTLITSEISSPSFQANLQYFNAITEAQSSAHVIQAQRDFFGSHGYARNDDEQGNSYHTNWK